MNFLQRAACALGTALVATSAGAAALSPTFVNIELGINNRHGVFAVGDSAFATDQRSDFVTNEYTESAQATVDLAAGTIKGKQSALGLTDLEIKGAAQARVTAGIDALVQVLGSPQVSAGTLVSLDLHAMLNASFTASDILGPLSSTTNDLVATFTIQRPGFAASTKIEYDYHWHRVEGGENFHHFHTIVSRCSTCTAEVVVEDPIDEFRNGFSNIDLHAVAPVRVGELYRIGLILSGQSQAFASGADGDWSHTARLNFSLPDGVTLFDTANEQLLSGWDSRIVPTPLPSSAALLLPAVALIWRRRRAAVTR